MFNMVRITNLGDEPVTRMYAGPDTNNIQQPVTLQPGKEQIVPWGVASLFCGDGTIRNSEYWRERDEAVRLLHLSYDALSLSGVDESKLPAIDVRDLDGNPIPTLLSDPEGNELTPDVPDDTSDVAWLTKQVQTLTEQLNRMQGGTVNAVETPDTEGETVTLDEIPEDTPKKVRVRR